MAVPISSFLVLGAVLFGIGAVGFLVRRNVLVALMSIELMLNAVNVTFVAFNRSHIAQHPGQHTGQHTGQVFAFFVIAIAAAEAAVGLAIVLAFFRLRRTVRSDSADLLKN